MKNLLNIKTPWLGLALLCSTFPLHSKEVQNHGLLFEHWIGDTFFNGFRPEYTGKWDIPGEINQARGGIPVNPKAIKYGTPVDLGDALRQFDIAEPFWLVIGYWEQRQTQKHFVNIVAARVEPDTWRGLWQPITRADLEKLDALIKDRNLDYQEARKQAHALNNSSPFRDAVIRLHPKIDSKGQRRLQCSLSFQAVFKYLSPESDPSPVDPPSLWGVPFPGPIASPPRSFSQVTRRNADGSPVSSKTNFLIGISARRQLRFGLSDDPHTASNARRLGESHRTNDIQRLAVAQRWHLFD